MTSKTVKKRPLAGSATARVWEIADEMYRGSGSIPTGRDVVDRYVAEGFNEGTGFTQYSHWKRAHRSHFKRADGSAKSVAGAASSVDTLLLTVAPDGRIVIPAEMRAAMELPENGRVSARVVDGELRLISPGVGVRKAQEMVRRLVPDTEGVVDAFLQERRDEARLEDGA